MRKVQFSTTVDIPLGELWDFVKDLNNWAPMVKGYQGHEFLNE